MTTEQRPTFRIDATQLAATRKKFDKINKRAEKQGLGGRLTLDAKRVEVTETNPLTRIETTHIAYDVVMGGSPPAYENWQFIATLDWDQHAGLIVRAAPGAAQVDRTSLREGRCDHCNTTRSRRHIYVVRNDDTGEQMQVGRSCIKDFTGWAGTITLLNSPGRDDDGEAWFGDPGQRDYSPLTVLAYAWAVIKLYGWVPASAAGHYSTPTRDRVLTAMYPSPRSETDMELARTLAPLADEATEKARKILDFILSSDFTGTSDYVLNLKAAAAGHGVSSRNFGLMTSAPQAYARHMEQTLRREREARNAESSEYFGEVKQRYDLTVTVLGLRYVESAYGTSTLYRLMDQNGNLFTYFASRDVLGENEGVQLAIRGTVKGHEEYKGSKITRLTRCKVLKEINCA